MHGDRMAFMRPPVFYTLISWSEISWTVPEHLGAIYLSLQKDSHTLYLEQELDSLKVVLDIKNKQLHQQEKKLMEIDKLVRPEAHENDYWASRQEKKKKKEPKNTWILNFFFLFFSFQTEKNVKLDEHLKKVQQENEDLKARMERHAALSR